MTEQRRPIGYALGWVFALSILFWLLLGIWIFG
jgi:hypothetical protein